MCRGVWHQFGNRSQRLALEQIKSGVGTGVVISPRDIGPEVAKRYVAEYRAAEADVALDPQFHVVGTSRGKLAEWGFDRFRTSTSKLHEISETELDELSQDLLAINRDLGATFLIAPSLIYESGRPDIVDVNRKLFAAAQSAGDHLGIPTLATIVVGRSAARADESFYKILSDATSVSASGWYYAFEFENDRIPNVGDDVLRAAKGCLSLAATGLPVFQAFAGPLGLVSVAAGATAVGIAHSQNLWRFTRENWNPSTGSGGGGDAPARVFSGPLWGTIVYPDEVALLPESLARSIIEPSPFARPSPTAPFGRVPRWEAGKHLVWTIGNELQKLLDGRGARDRCVRARDVLQEATKLHDRIAEEGIILRDGSASYQSAWRSALTHLLDERSADFEILEMLS